MQLRGEESPLRPGEQHPHPMDQAESNHQWSAAEGFQVLQVDFTDPAAVVVAFIRAMHGWESFAGSLSAGAQGRFRLPEPSSMHPEYVRVSDALRPLPALIVTVFLTERDRAYVPSCSYSTPPEYDPTTETVTRVVPKSKSQVLVETNRNSAFGGGEREYVVKRVGDIWLIDSVSQVIGGKKRKVVLV